MHQSISLQVYSEIASQDSQHDTRVLHSWEKIRLLVNFSEIKHAKVLQTCTFSEIAFCLNILNIYCVNHGLCVWGGVHCAR